MLKFPDKKKLAAFVKKNRLLLAIGAVGLLLMLIPLAGRAETPSPQGGIQESGEYDFDLRAYEKKLEQTLSSVKNVGRVSVLLYLKGGTETVYALEGSFSSRPDFESSESYKLAQSGGGPVVVKRLYPEFGGAVVVCDGGGSAVVAYEVTRAVASATGLRTDKIAVLPMGAK